MKTTKLFLGLWLLACSCQKASDEEFVDLDQMALQEEETIHHLVGDPLDTPQEILIKESRDLN